MRTAGSLALVGLLAGAAGGCAFLQGGGSGSARDQAAEEFALIEMAADSLAERMAEAISQRDAQALAWLYVAHPYAAFISDGLRIPQSRINDVIGGSYGALSSMSFVWERKQTMVLGRDAAAMTAWAVYTAVDTLGTATRERAVYSHVIVRERGRWRFLTTHKSAVERLPVSQGIRQSGSSENADGHLTTESQRTANRHRVTANGKSPPRSPSTPRTDSVVNK